jgi:hypothetical protein
MLILVGPTMVLQIPPPFVDSVWCSKPSMMTGVGIGDHQSTTIRRR